MSRKRLVLGLAWLFLLPVVNAGDNPMKRPMKFNQLGTVKTDFDPSHWQWPTTDTAIIPWTTEDSGEGTHLGSWHGTSSGGALVRLLPYGGIEILSMWGEMEIVADNGDKLYISIEWPDSPFTQQTATMTIHGGTGRFEQAGGTLNWVGDYTGEEWWDGSYHYSVAWGRAEGTITY